MTKRFLLSVSVILSTAIAAPVFAQAVAQEPGAYALNLPHVGTGIGSASSQQRDVSINSGQNRHHAVIGAIPSPMESRKMKWQPNPGQRRWGTIQPTAVDVLEVLILG